MTDYTAWNNSLPAGTSSTVTGSRNDGLQFSVSSASTLTGIAFYVPASETTLTGSSYTATLYSTTNGTSGTQVSQVTGSGTFTAGAWNWIPFNVSLSTGVTYVGVVNHPNSLQFESGYWSGATHGITNGPLTIPTLTAALGNKQQPNLSGAAAFPTNANNPGSWYGIDVKVSDVVNVSGTAAVTGKKITVSSTGSAPLRGTAAVTGKKITVSAQGPIPPSYNTGATATASGVTQATHPTLTIPSGVSAGEFMVIGVDLFGFTGDSGVAINITPGAGGNDWTQLDSLRVADDGSVKVYGAVFVRQATASDPGSVLTFSYSGTPTTDQKWWAIALASYPSLDILTAVAHGSSGLNGGTSILAPTGTTTVDDEWVIYVVPSAINSSGTIDTPPSGGTLRQNANIVGVASAIADTNGGVGPAGTSIGGGAWASSAAGGWDTSFTLSVGPKTIPPPNSVVVHGKKMTVAGVGNVTGSFSVSFNSSSSGIDSYDVTSQANGSGTHALRVVKPVNPDPHYAHSFLYLLPVLEDLGFTYGDPLAMAQTLGLHDTYNVTLVSAEYDIDPWYGDNPTDSTIQQETHSVWIRDWVSAHLSVTGTEKHYLTGFSKSGLGGAGLIFNHPDRFDKAALWDTPANDTAYNRFDPVIEDSAVYGTQGQFAARYELNSTNLSKWAVPFTATTRIWIGVGSSYTQETIDWHTRMNSAGILNGYDSTSFVSDTHAWHDDWLLGATSFLFAQVPSAYVSFKKASVAGSGDVSFEGDIGTGVITGKKMVIGSTGNLGIPGTGSVAGKKMVIGSAGNLGIPGTGAITIKKMTAAGTAAAPVIGTAAITIKKISVSGSSSKVLGTGNVTIKKMTVNVLAGIKISGTASVAIHKITISGSSSPQASRPASPLYIFSPL